MDSEKRDKLEINDQIEEFLTEVLDIKNCIKNKFKAFLRKNKKIFKKEQIEIEKELEKRKAEYNQKQEILNRRHRELQQLEEDMRNANEIQQANDQRRAQRQGLFMNESEEEENVAEPDVGYYTEQDYILN